MNTGAWSHRNDMPASSEERRRTEAALVRAIDVNPDVAEPATLDAVCSYVDALADAGHLPEAVVIAFKGALAQTESLARHETETREQLRSALVSACIQRYFTSRHADDVRVTRTPPLRLVRDDREERPRSPDAPM